MLIIALGISISGLKAEDQIPSPQEKTMLDMINHVRAEKGLQLLSFDERLYASASSHSLDMIEKNYYSSTSPDGKTFQERMLENRYIPVISGEALGMLSFRNFVNSDNAVKAISENMLADESDAERKQLLRLLNPDVRDIGISFRAGVFERNGVSENVYVVVCDVGSDDTNMLESSLLNMINDARKNPRKSFEDLGMEISDVQKSLGYYSWLMDSELNPLTNNGKLREAARNHTQDMIKRFYFDNVSPDGETPLNRTEAVKYKTVYINEILIAIVFEHFLDPIDAAKIFYEEMVKNDVYSSEEKSIFSVKAKDIGMNFDIVILDMVHEKSMKLYVLTTELGNDISIFGPVFVKEIYNKFYNFLEKNDI